MATTTSPDLLDPNAPKKTPGPAKPPAQPDMGGGTPSAIASPSTVDTGVPAPVAAPPPAPPAAAPTAAPPMAIETQALTTPAAAAPAAAPAPTDTSGVARFQGWAKQTFGREATPAELQQIASEIGYAGGPLTPQMEQAAQAAATRLAQRLGWAPPAPPVPTTASTAAQANTRLAELLNLSYGEVDPNSQAIQQPLGAFRSAQSRATDRARMAMALRNQSQGISPTSGAAEAGLLGLIEEQGQNEASFESNLYAQELATQREDLQEAITLATQAGQQDKARLLQEKLGTLDLELRKLLGQGQLALGQQSLNQDDRQFLERMGFNYAQLQGLLNNQAIQALLD